MDRRGSTNTPTSTKPKSRYDLPLEKWVESIKTMYRKAKIVPGSSRRVQR